MSKGKNSKRTRVRGVRLWRDAADRREDTTMNVTVKGSKATFEAITAGMASLVWDGFSQEEGYDEYLCSYVIEACDVSRFRRAFEQVKREFVLTQRGES